MDPVSLTASIVAILTLASTVTRYIVTASGAREGRKEVLNEITSIAGFIFVLKDLAEQGEPENSWCRAIKSLLLEDGPVDQFRANLEKLLSILCANHSSATRKALWPLQRGRIDEIRRKIEGQKSQFVLALQSDQLNLSIDTKNEIGRVHEGIRNIDRKISQLHMGQQMALEGIDKRDLESWLTGLNFCAKHNDIFSRWQEGTGQWLLESDIFQNWLAGFKRKLWCQGIPGAGKTILTSIIVNYLEKTFQHQNVGIAYIYCTYREQTSVSEFIASLLKQLIQQRRVVSSNILDLYRHHRRRQTRPSLTEYSRILLVELRYFSRVFILIDALDECSEESRIRDDFLTEVLKLMPMVSILITSRNNPDQKHWFRGEPDLVIRAIEGDVRRYLETRVNSELSSFVEKDSPLWNDILNTIVGKSHGMFLLAQLHMDSLGREDTRRGVRNALRRLPEEMDGTYNEAMNRIHNQDSRKVQRAEQVLSWICHAARPMTVDEIRYALAVETGDTEIDEEALPDGDLLVSVCAGLLTVDRDSNIIRFVHYTTQEYFERTREVHYIGAPTKIVMTCLTYLSFDVFTVGPCKSDDEMEARLLEHPLLRYASQYWGAHARGESEKDPVVQDLIMNFLQQDSKVSCSLQVSHIPKYRYDGYSQRFPKKVSALELGATLGLEAVTKRLLKADVNVNERDSDSGTALHWASWGGHDEIVKLLLKEKVEIDTRHSSDATPLHWAAAGGHQSIILLLLERGAKIAAVDVRKWTSMHRAAWNGHQAAVRVLLEKKADIKARDSDGGTVLHGAAERGHEDVVRLLLENGAEVNSEDVDGGTPLHRAAWNGHVPVVRLLLAHGANVKARYSYGGGEGGDSQGRKSSGQEVVMRLLLEKGADVAAKYYRGGTALHWAAWSGHKEVVGLLLEKGADFTARDSEGGTALSAAAEGGYDTVVELLRRQGADIDGESSGEETEVNLTCSARDQEMSTSLHWAAWGGREETVKPLLEEGGGTNIDATNENGRTALHWAAWSGHRIIVQLLLEKGANISCQDNSHWTALHWAAWNGHDSVVKLLLKEGARVDMTDHNGKTALDWAMAENHYEVANVLRASG